jgi:hypothetical protein
MRILLWHVHGSWATAFVQGPHEYLIPVTPGRGSDGAGRARTWDWPASAREVTPGQLGTEPVDLVLLQRPHELELAQRWLGGRRPGRDVPAIYVEHNTPKGGVPETEHPLAGQNAIPIVHVTHFNRLFWDSGRAPALVVEHGVPDPGYRYTGELARTAVAINEPVRRWRVTGTDLLPRLAEASPLDVFGMKVTELPARLGLPADRLAVYEDLPQDALHAALARRRVYAHPLRWTSLGLSLIEAMMLGLPVAVLATTESVHAVPDGAGVLSTDPAVLAAAIRRFCADPDWAAHTGKQARAAALARYGLDRFLRDWDRLIEEVTR